MSLFKVLVGVIYSASAAAFIRAFQNFKVLKTWKIFYSFKQHGLNRPQIPEGEPAYQAMFYSL